MCESDHYTEERMQTLYGVVHEAMLAGKPYTEVVFVAKKWVVEHSLYYIRTCVEDRDGLLYLVVRTCADFREAGKKECVVVTDVQVTNTFLLQAQERLRQQLA